MIQINKYITGIVAGLILMLSGLIDAARVRNIYPLDKSYYNEVKLLRELLAITRDNPSFTRLHTIGTTRAGKRPIYALQIQKDINREPVLIVGQVHGDEVLGIEIAMAFAGFLTSAKPDDRANELLDKYSFWIVPTLNPDGWNVVTSGQYQWKRKNNTDTNRNGKLDIKTDGVDLNRNFPTFWHLDKGQSAHGPYYKGVAPASEAETRAIMELGEMHRFKYALFYHSSVTGAHSEKIFLPWQDSKNDLLIEKFAAIRAFADTYALAVPRDYAEGTYEVHPGYTSKVGNARNHFFYTWGTFTYDIEVGGNNKSGKGIVHPPAQMRTRVVQKNLNALIRTFLSH